MTAEELLEKYRFEAGEHIGNRDYDRMCEFAKEFAKLHVLAALEAAYKNCHRYYDPGEEEYDVDRDSIITAYPLKNIK